MTNARTSALGHPLDPRARSAATRAQAGSGGVPPAGPTLRLYALRPSDVWSYLKRQPPSFWLICFYLGFEYVRPQTIYPAIADFPWAFTAIVACLLAYLLEGGRFRKLNVADGGLAIFSLVVLASSLFAVYPSDSYSNFNFFFSWVVIYLLITNVVNSREKYILFLLAYLIYCLKMSQYGVRSWASAGFMFRTWGTTCAPGWFSNSGECGIQMVMYFVTALYFIFALSAYWGKFTRIFFWIMPVTAAITVLGSSSRGGVIGLAAVLIWMLTRSKHRVKAFIYIAVMAIGMFVALPQGAKDRFNTIGDDQTSQSRLTYWKDGVHIMMERPVLGIGYYNWLTYYHARYAANAELPHNIFVQAGTEMGFLGLGAFIFLIVVTFKLNRRTRRYGREAGDQVLPLLAFGLDGALIGYLVTGFFVTVLYYPFFWINLAMTVCLNTVAQKEAEGRLAGAAAGRWRRPGVPAPVR